MEAMSEHERYLNRILDRELGVTALVVLVELPEIDDELSTQLSTGYAQA